MNNLYYIRNVGCDDETVGLAQIPDEYFPKFKEIIENLNKNSTYGCMPVIKVYKIDESVIRAANEEDGDWRILYLEDKKYVLKDNFWNLQSDLIKQVI